LSVTTHHAPQPVRTLPHTKDMELAFLKRALPGRDGSDERAEVWARDSEPTLVVVDLEDVKRDGHARVAKEAAQRLVAIGLDL
jgi:hypothetical protein